MDIYLRRIGKHVEVLQNVGSAERPKKRLTALPCHWLANRTTLYEASQGSPKVRDWTMSEVL